MTVRLELELQPGSGQGPSGLMRSGPGPALGFDGYVELIGILEHLRRGEGP